MDKVSCTDSRKSPVEKSCCSSTSDADGEVIVNRSSTEDIDCDIDIGDCDLDVSPCEGSLSSIEDLCRMDRVRLSWHSIDVHADLPKPPLLRRCLDRRECKTPQQKQILFNVAGSVDPGTLMAIMGSSGAGKTTLMNVLAHRNIGNVHVTGIVQVNKKQIGRRIKRFSAYLQQEDLFIGTLTVKEHLTFQALLRIGSCHTKKEKMDKVTSVINELGLNKCENCLIGVPGKIRGISGGELKRLAFASEILTNPSLLFVDEPTSGLDSYMALSVVSALQRLASSGRTILATIHQPSSEVYALFDSILLMSEGRVAYIGPTKECVPFFRECGYPLPPNYNPADFFINTLAIVPGKEDICKERARDICTFFRDKHTKKLRRSLSIVSFAEERRIEKPKYKEGCSGQFKALLWRGFRKIRREPTMSYMRIGIRLSLAIIIGLVYLNQSNNQNSVQNINGVLFFMALSSTMGTYGPSLLTLSSDFPVFLKEHRIAMYRVDLYLITTMISELPITVFGQVMQGTLIYWMTGLHNDAGTFFTFTGISILIGQSSLSFAYFVSALIPNIKILAAVGNLFIFPMVLFGGFFINVSTIPVYFIWLKHLSFVKYGYESFIINQWRNVQSIDCPLNSTVPCLPNGMAVLEQLGFSLDNLVPNVGIIIALIIGFRFLAFLLLFARAWRK